MAGDWIKMTKDLPDKPEVWRMAGMLGIDADSVVGKLLRVWAWFDSHTENGNASGVTYPLLDRIAGVTGFAEAMTLCGWLQQNGHTLVVPNFERHNGKTAKNRALTNERVGKLRTKQRDGNAESNADTVTKSVSREEKRREEINTPKPPSGVEIRFERFWAAYPKKVGRDAALKAFEKRKPDSELLDLMLAAVNAQKLSPAWVKEGGQFIPNPATWLNQGRWQDESSSDAAAGQNPIFAGVI